MSEILISEEEFETPQQIHAYIAHELGFPSHYGANLDALNDCLGDISEPCTLQVSMANTRYEQDMEHAQDQALALWFPKFVRSLLRAARDNDALEVVVHAESLDALQRLIACPGLLELVRKDAYITQALIAKL